MKKLLPLLELVLGLILIALGAEIVNYFGIHAPPLKYVGLIGFAIIFFGGFKVLINLLVYAVAFYFVVIGKNTSLNTEHKPYKLTRYLLLALLAFSVFWLTVQSDIIDNTLDGLNLLLNSAIIGLTIGILILIIVLGIKKDVRYSSLGLDLFLSVPLICMVLSSATASHLNQIPVTDPTIKEFIVNDTSRTYGSRTRIQHFVFVDNSGHEERLIIEEPLWNDISPGDVVEIELTQGLLGYYTVGPIREKMQEDTSPPSQDSQ